MFFKTSRKGQTIKSQTKQVILNVYSRIREDNPALTVEEIVSKVSSFTGVSPYSIYDLNKYKRPF